MQKNTSPELSKKEIIFAFVGVALMLVPLVLVTVFGDNQYVQFLLGGWRIFLFWGIVIPAAYYLEKKTNPDVRRFWPTPDPDHKNTPPFAYGAAAVIVVLLPVGLLHFLGDEQWVQFVFGGGRTLGFWAVGLLAIYAVERITSSSAE